jgi:transposase
VVIKKDLAKEKKIQFVCTCSNGKYFIFQDHMQINIHNILKRINSSKAAEKGFIPNKYKAHSL